MVDEDSTFMNELDLANTYNEAQDRPRTLTLRNGFLILTESG